jgi:hypothetical protein
MDARTDSIIPIVPLSGELRMNGRDRHYLNEEGNCVACSEFKGLWPDDDDEGDIEEEPAEE